MNKKSVSKADKTPKKDAEKTNESMKKEDDVLLKSSMTLIEDLKTQIGRINDSKNALQESILSIKQRVEKISDPLASIDEKKKIKELVLKEIEPLLDKYNISSIRKYVYSDIEELVNKETNKIKSETDYHLSQNKKDFTKQMSYLESKMVESKNFTQKLSEDLKSIRASKKEILTPEQLSEIRQLIKEGNSKLLEKENIKNSEVYQKIDSYTQKIYNLEDEFKQLRKDSKQADTKQLLELKNELSATKQSLDKLEKETLKNLKKKAEDELLKLKDELSITKQGLDKLEKETLKTLTKKTEDELLKLRNELVATKQNLDKIDSETLNRIKKKTEEELSKYLSKNQQEISKDIKELEHKYILEIKKLESIYKSDYNNIQKQFSDLKSNFSSEIKKEFSELVTGNKKLEKQILDISNTQIGEIKKNNQDFKNEYTLKLKDLINEKEIEREFIVQKTNELIENFNNLTEENKLKFVEHKKDINVLLQSIKAGFEQEIKDRMSQELVKISNFLLSIEKKSNDTFNEIDLNIQGKFLKLNEQLEKDFKLEKSSFEKFIKSKELDFENTIKKLLNEKEALVIELNQYKQQVSALTKEYIQKLDSELKTLKSAHDNFENEKNKFLDNLNTILEAKKTDLTQYSDGLKGQIFNQLTSQQEMFSQNENSFKIKFQEKVKNLEDLFNRRIHEIEVKFIDKNISVVKEKVDAELEFMKIFEDKLISKEGEIDKKIDILDDLQNHFQAEAKHQSESMHQKVEERLINLEKHFNKRFLDYDGKFSSLKSIIVEEVEDLIKEVNQVLTSQVDELKKHEAKLDFKKNEIQTIRDEFYNIKNTILPHYTELCKTVKDLKVQVFGQLEKQSDISSLVYNMSSYENQLIKLISDLQEKGLSFYEIQNILLQKGHPRVYVTTLISQLGYNQ